MPAFFSTYKRIFPIIDDLMMLEIQKDTPENLIEDKIIGLHALFADKAKNFIENMVHNVNGICFHRYFMLKYLDEIIVLYSAVKTGKHLKGII